MTNTSNTERSVAGPPARARVNPPDASALRAKNRAAARDSHAGEDGQDATPVAIVAAPTDDLVTPAAPAPAPHPVPTAAVAAVEPAVPVPAQAPSAPAPATARPAASAPPTRETSRITFSLPRELHDRAIATYLSTRDELADISFADMMIRFVEAGCSKREDQLNFSEPYKMSEVALQRHRRGGRPLG